MLIPILCITLLGAFLGFGLAVAARRFKVEGDPLVEEVAAMMPGSQCGLCGMPSCGTAAERMVKGEAGLTACVPGGKALAQRIAEKLGVPLILDDADISIPKMAMVKEEICTGCGKCNKICSNDAVIGAAKQIHSVLAELCNGCGKCVELCPTEALYLTEVPITLRSWHWAKPSLEAQA